MIIECQKLSNKKYFLDFVDLEQGFPNAGDSPRLGTPGKGKMGECLKKFGNP